MRVLDWPEIQGGALSEERIAATIGVFDGLHIGHRDLVGRILGRPGLASLVLTFKENPKRILSPGTHQGELSTIRQKLELLEAEGVDFCALIDFSGDFSKLPGRRFLDALKRRGGLEYLAVGENFRCGADLDTGAAEIEAFGAENGVGIELVTAVQWGGRPVSSSRIRRAVADGRLEDAEAMLGRPFEVDMRGALPAGPGLWAPSGAQARPPQGIYEARVNFGPGAAAFQVSARLDSEGHWSIVGGSVAEGGKAEGLRLSKLVSRE